MPRMIDYILAEDVKPAKLFSFFTRDNFVSNGRLARESLTKLHDSNPSSYDEFSQVIESDDALVRMHSSYTEHNQHVTSSNYKAFISFARKVLESGLEDSEIGRMLMVNNIESIVNAQKMSKDDFSDTVVIVADDVAKYEVALEAVNGTHGDGDYGRLAPLFDSVFVEFKVPVGYLPGDRAGVLIETVSQEEVREQIESYSSVQNEKYGAEMAPFLSVLDEAKWLIRRRTLLQLRNGDVVGPICDSLVALDSDGRVIKAKNLKGDLAKIYNFSYIDPISLQQVNAESMQPAAIVHTKIETIGALTVSFAHCTNVEVVDRDPNLDSPKLLAKHKKKFKRPFEIYKTLKVPMIREVIEAVNEAAKNGKEFALHIVRGHFKTFTKEKPLFGQHDGEYYWADQIRGIPEKGVVAKEYDVQAPDVLAKSVAVQR